MPKKFFPLLGAIKKSEKGATLVYFALSLPVLAGFAGLGFDATMWYMDRRILQNVTDASAMAAAYALSKGGDQNALVLAANTDAANNNYVIDGDHTLTVVSPPTSGPFAGLTNHVQVMASMPAEGTFSSVIGVAEGTITTTAIAGITASGEHCILALSDTMDQAIDLSESATINLDCGIASNSNSNQSIYLNGNVNVTANPSLQSYGDIYEGGSSTLTTPNPIQPFSQKTVDPYKNLTVPLDPVGCTVTNYSFPNNATQRASDPFYDSATDTFIFTPGRYCGDLDFSINSSSKGDIAMEPGIYIIDSGDFNIGSQANVYGDGVTIILTATDPNDIGNIDINGGGDVTLNPPTTGDYAGVVIYQDRRANYVSNANKINGSSTMTLNGAVYFPSQELSFLGNTGGGGACTQLVGAKVKISGNTDTNIVNNDAVCDAYGVKDINRTLVKLVK